MDAVLSADAACELGPAGPVVGMHVRVDDVRQPKTLRAREFDVGIDVVSPCIDDGAFAEGPAAEHVGRAAEIVVIGTV